MVAKFVCGHLWGKPVSGGTCIAIATDLGSGANYQNNLQLVEWVNQQSLSQPITCLGDGHAGVWNIVQQIALFRPTTGDSRVGITLKRIFTRWGAVVKRLNQAEALLWLGKVDAALELFEDSQKKQAQNFCQYLRKHRHRIVNYDYFQAEQLCSIGSGAVESAIKQIDRRVQISGAQWNAGNVPQVLAHRCAYINGLIGLQN